MTDEEPAYEVCVEFDFQPTRGWLIGRWEARLWINDSDYQLGYVNWKKFALWRGKRRARQIIKEREATPEYVTINV